jgi:uncharacterized protein (TIGR02300 family)
VAKSELGTKRVCPDTGRKFYDLGKTPVISPYTGKIVPIAPMPAARSRPDTAATTRAVAEEPEVVVPEVAEAEFVSLEEAEAEQQGKKPTKVTPAADDEDVEVDDESLDDAAFIEDEEEGDADVSDIIGESIEKEDES